jgi:hypothetical protein
VSKKLKWILAIAIGLLLALFAYAAAGPYLAVNGIRNLVASKQYGELWRFVDFDRLREDLRPQVQERIARGILGRVGPSQTGRTIGEVTAMVAKPAIDAMVSPQGIATLLTGSALARDMAGKVETDGRAHAADPLQGAKTRFESASLFTATVANAEGKPVVFEFHREGLSWKLAGLRLPE